MKTNSFPIMALLIALVIVNCGPFMSMKEGRKMDPEKLAMIKEGETTKPQVLKLLGEPGEISSYGGREVFTYMYMKVSMSLVQALTPFGMPSQENQIIQISFDEKGTVLAISKSEGKQ